MTFGDLQNLTAFWLDDLNFGYFTTTQVKMWLNNAQRETQKLLLAAGENYYVDCVQTTLVVNQQQLVLPADFMKLHRLEVIVSGSAPNETKAPLAPISLNQQDLVPQFTGQPQYYYIKKNRLVLWPTPDTALTLRLHHSPMVDDMVNNSDVPDVPTHYHEFLAVLATIDGLLKDQRDASQMMAKRAYYEAMLKQDSDERNQDAPRSVVQTGSGVEGAFFW